MLTDGIDDQHISCYGYPTGQPLRAPDADGELRCDPMAVIASATAHSHAGHPHG